LTSPADLTVHNHAAAGRPGPTVRWLLPLGWALAAVGYFGPWIAHKTAALTVTGADMAEFVKFVPGVAEGSIGVYRQFFFLPPLAVVISVAVLISSARLGYPWVFRALVLGLSIPLSLQLLPPAWSPQTLLTAEFRLQTAALGLAWLLLASFWPLARLPQALRTGLSALAGLAAAALAAWQYLILKPAVDGVYGSPVGLGWGLVVCLGGLSLMTVASILLFSASRPSRTGPWTT
jgi:hypothetical protein